MALSEDDKTNVAGQLENDDGAQNPTDEKKYVKIQASVAQVFSFAKTTKAKLYIVLAFIASIVSGLNLPAMVFYFAAVFEELGAPQGVFDNSIFLDNVWATSSLLVILSGLGY